MTITAIWFKKKIEYRLYLIFFKDDRWFDIGYSFYWGVAIRVKATIFKIRFDCGYTQNNY